MLSNLANATVYLGEQDAAVDIALQAIALSPDASLPRRTLCNVLPYQEGTTPEAMLLALADCASRLNRTVATRFTNRPDPDRPLRVGLLSGSFRAHPVGWLTVAGFEALDPTQFKLTCFSRAMAASDAINQRFRVLARDWVETDRVYDAALTTAARDQGIDILIDLGGYGDAARMPACANRLAPVQIKWVGMQCHSSGLAEMDWFLTDRGKRRRGSSHSTARSCCA